MNLKFLNDTIFINSNYKGSKQDFILEVLKIIGITEYEYSDPTMQYRIYTGERLLSKDAKKRIKTPFNQKGIRIFLDKIIPENSVNKIIEILNIKIDEQEKAPLLYSIAKQYELLFYSTDKDTQDIIPETYKKVIENRGILYDAKDAINTIDFINEVNNTCPICLKHKPLTGIDTFGKKINNYYIIQIFPEDCSKEEYEELLKIETHVPRNYNDFQNNIAVCKECGNYYANFIRFDIKQYIKEYIKIRTIKNDLIENKHIEYVLGTYKINEQINEIINIIDKNKIKEYKIYEVDYNPHDIDEKLSENENNFLAKKIKSCSSEDYAYIRGVFSDKTLENTNFFEETSQKISDAYEYLKDKYTNKKIIFQKLVKWLNQTTTNDSKYENACEIIISFFVQDCEVFKIETTK